MVVVAVIEAAAERGCDGVRLLLLLHFMEITSHPRPLIALTPLERVIYLNRDYVMWDKSYNVQLKEHEYLMLL